MMQYLQFDPRLALQHGNLRECIINSTWQDTGVYVLTRDREEKSGTVSDQRRSQSTGGVSGPAPLSPTGDTDAHTLLLCCDSRARATGGVADV